MEKTDKKLNFQTILLIITIGILLLEKVVMPNVNSGDLSKQVRANELSITRIEQCVKTLETVPDRLARIEGMLNTIAKEEKK